MYTELNAAIARMGVTGAGEVMLTPELAKQLLATRNSKQRQVRPAQVKALAQSLRNKEFHTAESSILLINGVLANGQHRCLAVAETGITPPTPQLFRVSDNEIDWEFIDTGARRTLADRLRYDGFEHPKRVKETLSWIFLYASAGGSLHAGRAALSKMTGDLTLAKKRFAEKYQVEMERCTNFVWKNSRKEKGQRPGLASTLLFLTETTGGAQAAQDFVLSLCKNDAAQPSPTLGALYKEMLLAAQKAHIEAQRDLLAKYITAFDYYVEGRVVSKLRYNPEKPFPRLVFQNNRLDQWAV